MSAKLEHLLQDSHAQPSAVLTCGFPITTQFLHEEPALWLYDHSRLAFSQEFRQWQPMHTQSEAFRFCLALIFPIGKSLTLGSHFFYRFLGRFEISNRCGILSHTLCEPEGIPSTSLLSIWVRHHRRQACLWDCKLITQTQLTQMQYIKKIVENKPLG